jgi:predicted ATPase
MAARRATTAQGLELTGSQLLERDAALEAGQKALDSALEDAGALVAFEGPVGIGRSTLLSALGDRAAEAGILSLQTRCSEGEQQLAFGTVLNLFEQHVADLGGDELDSLFAGRAGVASSLLTGEGLRDPEALLRGAPRATLRLTHALYRVTANLASSEPVVLMVDDLQWADPESLQFLLYLAPRLAQISASLVVTVRDGVAPDVEAAVSDLIGAQSARVDRLAPLGKRSVRKLVTEQSGACTRQSAEAVHHLTGGNPMLVHELIAAAREAGLPLDRASASEI